MGKIPAWGKKAYNETRKNGGSKEEAKVAQQLASEEYSRHLYQQRFGRSNSFKSDVSNFNNSINDGRWHTADDL